MDTRSPQASEQMRRQLARQHKQQEQQQQASPPRRTEKDLPAKQDQTRHNPVSETLQRGSFMSDQ